MKVKIIHTGKVRVHYKKNVFISQHIGVRRIVCKCMYQYRTKSSPHTALTEVRDRDHMHPQVSLIAGRWDNWLGIHSAKGPRRR